LEDSSEQNYSKLFKQLADDEQQRIRKSNSRKEDYLYARGIYVEESHTLRQKGKPKPPKTGLWALNGGDGYAQKPFRVLAELASIALDPPPKDADRVDWWLHQLYLYLRENHKEVAVCSDEIGALSVVGDLYVDEDGGRRYYNLPENNNAYLFAASDERGVIFRVCEASAMFCARLESEAKLRAAQTKSKPEERPQLTDREKKIWEIIQRVAGGRLYCRELDNSQIAPRKSGVWKDAPRKYLAAYDLGKPWRHRIEDEKAKIRRKAEAAKLAGALASE
jgi:hypothetical protein